MIPAPADSPPSEALAPPLALSLLGAVFEKGGREVVGLVPSIKVGLPAFNFDYSRSSLNFLAEGPRAPT